MVTEEHPTKNTPTEAEFNEFSGLADKIKTLNAGIDEVRDRLAYRLPVTDAERVQLIRDELELERLLAKAQTFIDRFG